MTNDLLKTIENLLKLHVVDCIDNDDDNDDDDDDDDDDDGLNL